jgi:hypothetical protein
MQLSSEEMIEALEFARVAMGIKDVRERVATEMDLCDEYISGLKEKLDATMEHLEIEVETV